jgi:hypothetical protein
MREPEGWQLMTFAMCCGVLAWVGIIVAVLSFLR